MKLITQARRLGVIAVSAAMAACATTGQDNEITNQYSVGADYSTYTVHFNRLNVVESDQGILLKGTIRRRSANTPVPSGHVDVLVTAANGDVLLDTAAQYRPTILLRYTSRVRQRGSTFTVKLPEGLPKDADIKVAYHRNSFQKSVSSPSAQHRKNSLI